MIGPGGDPKGAPAAGEGLGSDLSGLPVLDSPEPAPYSFGEGYAACARGFATRPGSRGESFISFSLGTFAT